MCEDVVGILFVCHVNCAKNKFSMYKGQVFIKYGFGKEDKYKWLKVTILWQFSLSGASHFILFYYCFCMGQGCMPVYLMHTWYSVHTCRDRRRTSSVFLYHCLSYSFNTPVFHRSGSLLFWLSGQIKEIGDLPASTHPTPPLP